MDDKTRKEFDKQTKKSGACLLWTGRGYGDKGYGLFKFGDFNLLAHRAAFIAEAGYVPAHRVLQSCGNKRCVAVEHLSEDPRDLRP